MQGSDVVAVRDASDSGSAGGGALADLQRRLDELERLYRDAPDGMHSLDSQGVVVRMNRTELTWLGYEAEEVLGHEYRAFLAPSSRTTFDREFPRFLAGGEAREIALELVRKDGRVLQVSLSATPVRDESGRFRWSNAIVRDVGERLRGEADLRAAEARYRRLVDNVNGVVWEADPHTFRFRFVSPYAERLLGYPVGRWTDEPTFWVDHLHPDDQDRVVSSCRRQTGNGVPHVLEYRMIAADGRDVYIRDTVAVHLVDGKATLLTGVMVDVSDRCRAEAELRDAVSLVESALESTADGLLVVDRGRRIVRHNTRFAQMWQTPEELLISRDDALVLSFVADQLVEPEAFLARVHELYASPEADSFDVLRFKDGRVFERYSSPQVRGGEVIGRVWSFRDVTERRRVEAALRASEQKYRSLYTQTPVMMHSIDRDGRLVSVSNHWLATLGYERHEVIGRKSVEFLTPASRRYAEEVVLPAYFRTGACRDVPYQFVHKDGTILDALLSATAERDAEGGVLRSLAVIVDVTDRNQVERALRESEARFQTLARVSPVGIWRTDAAGECIYVNERWCEISGLAPEEARGRGWARAIHPDDRDRVVEHWNRAARGEAPFVAEYRMLDPRGVATWVLGQAAAERASDGEVVGYVGTITDITQRRRAEEELREYRARLEEIVAARTRELASANLELESFSSAVSHDLRAPLRAIDAYCRLLLEEQAARLDPASLEHLRRVHLASQRMRQLVEDLLRLSRVTRGTVRREPVDLAAIAREIAGDLRAADPGRVVEFVFPDTLVAEGDPDLLRILLENLLGNAWKFTSHHARARIELAVDTVDGSPVYRVRDDGAGFDPAYAGRLFRAFERLHAQSEFEGTGIGLATVRRIVERHCGRVWAEGAVEAGATVSFTLGEGPGARVVA
ncbi:MAG: PAS domain S-box protein [Myxococcota bacterium]